jgi:outer membrane protein
VQSRPVDVGPLRAGIAGRDRESRCRAFQENGSPNDKIQYTLTYCGVSMKARFMKSFFALLLACASLISVPAQAQAQELKIGYVNGERIVRDSDLAKRSQARLEAEFAKREKDLNAQNVALRARADQLDKDAPTLSEAEKTRRQRELVEIDRDLQRKHREFQEDLAQRKNEELASIAERANRIIKAIGDAEHYDIILQDQLVAYVSNRVDLTRKVIDALNAGK